MGRGKVFLVGAGPGDQELLTVKAVEVLRKADVVIYDRLVSKSILELAPKTTKMIYVGKSSGKHELPQEKINELLISAALDGKKVVRLKGGDPFLFGRGGEEAEALADNNIDFEVVPGVTSALVVPAYAGIPLTHRDYASSVAIVTGHRAGNAERIVNWSKLASAVDTIVILMGVESLESIATKLMGGGLDPNVPVAVIERGTSKRQRSLIGRLGTIASEAKERNVKPPAVIVIGEVVNLGRKLSWFKTPLR
ncbi:MAG: uroporphyrinogen-III C-methyltransferase [Dehalococcoidia bacterium]|jgi:uroporphyrinogen III methyltransferase/synthase|nr:uroporphyrinogen-III C-methyltransferase [Dehalococcoidia bacterium]